MTSEPSVKPAIAAWLGLLGTIAGSFLPGFLSSAVFAIISGGDGKFGPGGLIAIYAYILFIFTLVTVASYVIGLLSLLLVARVRRPAHAFWLAAVAGLLTLPALFTMQPVVVAVVHVVVFAIGCLLYRQSGVSTQIAAG